jgi:hypothetical protein
LLPGQFVDASASTAWETLMATRARTLLSPLVLALVCTATWAQPNGGLTPAPVAPPVPGAPPTPGVNPAPRVGTARREMPGPSETTQPPRSIAPRPGTPIATGTVSRLLPDADGNVEGLLLSDGTQVRFPPHMSQELAAAIKPGSAVNVEGYREAGGAVRARVITDQATRRSVTEHDAAPSTVPPNLHSTGLGPLTAEGRIQHLMRDPAGDVNGVVLEDGSVVRFPPNVRRQFPGVLQPGISISASGYGMQSEYGRALNAATLGAGDRPPQPLSDHGLTGAPGAPR